ncbi:MAG TPA: transaldolase [Candidatus Omnitrophica bacterium]|nr:transaldolase [Candidatus Omnitrophota bacterium]
MSETRIMELDELGQSAWLDHISRSLIDTGKLNNLIKVGLRGMTSNPTIFDKAISSSADYDAKILELTKSGRSIFQIYDDLTVKDVQDAADIFLSVYDETNGLDGYVSLEINPELAYKADETIKEGMRLHQKVSRPNVMLKVPATDEGFIAVEELVAAGINVNVTLIFSQAQYENTANAYLRGIKRFLECNPDAASIRSVASVFISRIDTLVDKMLDELMVKEKDAQKKERLRSLCGRAAVANSARIYRKYLDIFTSDEFDKFKDKKVNTQRTLWGSTSTKNAAYSDIKYVTELIAKNTVNTIPENTLNAFLDHGEAKVALTSDASEAENIINSLNDFCIDINEICAKLLKDGVIAFEKSFKNLLEHIEAKVKELS